jgi:hypothetical protein
MFIKATKLKKVSAVSSELEKKKREIMMLQHLDSTKEFIV